MITENTPPPPSPLTNGGIMLTLKKHNVIGSNSIDDGAAGDIFINNGGANREMWSIFTNGFINNRDECSATIYDGDIMLTLQKHNVIGRDSIDNRDGGDTSFDDGGANRGMWTILTNSFINNRDGCSATIYDGSIILTLHKYSVIGSDSIDDGDAGDIYINNGGSNRGMWTMFTSGFINNRDGYSVTIHDGSIMLTVQKRYDSGTTRTLLIHIVF